VGQLVVRRMHHRAEEDGNGGAKRRQKDDPDQGEGGQGGNKGQIKMYRVCAEHQRNKVSGERRNDAGNQSGVVDDTDADNLHREEGGGERCAEKGGENRAHAAHYDEAHILIVQAEPLAHLRTDGTAQLKGCTFPSGRTAAEVGKDGADKDQRCQCQRDRAVTLGSLDDLVGAEVFGGTKQAVQKGDDHAGHRKQV